MEFQSDCRFDIIVFFFPYKVVSGGPIYLSNLAINLAKAGIWEVLYIDYEDGMAKGLLKDTDVKLIEYDEKEKLKLFFDERILLITPIYWAHRVPELHPDSLVLFLNWHNLCIPSLIANIGCDEETIISFLEVLASNNSVFFCDKAHWMAQEEYGVDFPEIYVPITIKERIRQASKGIVDSDKINIAVVGRLVVDKIYAITDILDNITESYVSQKEINIIVIGDGDCRKLLEDYQKPQNISLDFRGTLSIEEINDVLSKEVDILFAMGTSVLEGAAIGLPSVVIPNDIKPFHCNRYTFLNECNGFLLGWGPDQIDSFDLKTHGIDEIFNLVYEENNKYKIGLLCQEYYKQFHSDNTKYIFEAIKMNTLSYKDYLVGIRKVQKMLEDDMLEEAVTMIRENKEKKVVIWGAGKGGWRLRDQFFENGISVDFFVDKKYLTKKTWCDIPVKDIAVLDSTKHIVFVSLLKFDIDIVKHLEEKSFIKDKTYLYVRFTKINPEMSN